MYVYEVTHIHQMPSIVILWKCLISLCIFLIPYTASKHFEMKVITDENVCVFIQSNFCNELCFTCTCVYVNYWWMNTSMVVSGI